jgi:hypothetical protein
MMDCEEFELRGLDMDRADADPQEAAQAARHAELCAHCRAMLESWREVKGDLRLLRDSTRLDSAPSRVEMRLKQELRTRREARVPHSTVAVASWAVAAAMVLTASAAWLSWHRRPHEPVPSQQAAAPNAPAQVPTDPGKNLLVADKDKNLPATPRKTGRVNSSSAAANEDDSGRFTLLPGSLPAETEETAIVRVRMQRGALGALGFPVNQERAGEWILVDLLVANDGQPQAVRLAR